jgi:hypothetical protein
MLREVGFREQTTDERKIVTRVSGDGFACGKRVKPQLGIDPECRYVQFV